MINPFERGTTGERHYIVDRFVEAEFGDASAGDETGGEYSQLYSCGWDPADRAYIVLGPNAVWRGGVQTDSEGDFVLFDIVHADEMSMALEESVPTTLIVRLKEDYDG